jgi:hypothetical protein
VNRSPAFAVAKSMKVPASIAVDPLFWCSVPFWTFAILKCVTSPLSFPFRLMTRPEVVWTCAFVVAPVTDGVSATGVTVMAAVTTLPPRPPFAFVVDACASKLAGPK